MPERPGDAYWSMVPYRRGDLEEDGLNPGRALILQAYYGLRRGRPPSDIGAREIAEWIDRNEPDERVPSAASIQLTLVGAQVPHRAPGRPRTDSYRTADSAPEAIPGCEVGTVLLPALLAPHIEEIAKDVAAQAGVSQEVCGHHLEALVGRLSAPGGWQEQSRRAEAEPVVTGRSAPYDESTVRKAARAMAEAGATEVVSRRVEEQVMQAAKTADCVTAYTDMYDQVYWTKKDAWSGPVGGLGNRRLACTYFGVTFVRVGPNGPVLGYCVTWHKPASPLLDALVALHADPVRHEWLTENVDLHIFDRGGSGAPARQYAFAQGIPYFTIGKGKVKWTEGMAASLKTDGGAPIYVRFDPKVRTDETESDRELPYEVAFPAKTKQGAECRRAIPYYTAATLTVDQLKNADVEYKDRWPANENQIKELVGAGFGVNRDRGMETTTSRGQDGQRARLEAEQSRLEAQVEELRSRSEPGSAAACRKLEQKREKLAQQRSEHQAQEVRKGVRLSTGCELLCKNLILLVHNALALLLYRSTVDAVRVMTMTTVRTLLLGRPMLVRITPASTTLWVDALGSPRDRVQQVELVRLFNEANLSLHGKPLSIRLRVPP